MVGKGHLKVLAEVDSPTTRQALVSSLNYTPGTISDILGDLEEWGLIDRERTGTTTTIVPVEVRCVQVFHSLVKTNPHIEFPELLTKSTQILLYHLTNEQTLVSTLAIRTGLSEATIYRHLKKLQNRAIVLKDESRYRLTDDFVELHTFAVELYRQLHRKQLKDDTDGAVLIWESHDEFLVQTDQPVNLEGYHRTGLGAFSEYSLQFFTTSSLYYYYAPSLEKLDASDLICHLLLIENDTRNRQYALLLVAREDLSDEDLIDRAEYYRMTDVMNPLLDFLRSRGSVSHNHHSSWREFKSLADEYDVEI